MNQMVKGILVNGNSVSLQELQELQNDPNVRVIKISENNYKTLNKLNG